VFVGMDRFGPLEGKGRLVKAGPCPGVEGTEVPWFGALCETGGF